MFVNAITMSQLAVRVSATVTSFQQGAQVADVLSTFKAEPAPWLKVDLLKSIIQPILQMSPSTAERGELREAFEVAIQSLNPIAQATDFDSMNILLGAERILSTMDVSAYVFAKGTSPGPVETEVEPIDFTQIRVLFVDDEPSIRKSIIRLQRGENGMTADQFVEASTADEALDSIMDGQINLDDIDVLITDYHMTGMTGVELANQLRQTRPNLPVILISGYPQKVEDDGITAFMEKPFSAGDITAVLLRLIEAARQR